MVAAFPFLNASSEKQDKGLESGVTHKQHGKRDIKRHVFKHLVTLFVQVTRSMLVSATQWKVWVDISVSPAAASKKLRVHRSCFGRNKPSAISQLGKIWCVYMSSNMKWLIVNGMALHCVFICSL